MTIDNTVIAKAYYTAMSKKNIPEIAKYLHQNVEFIGPLGTMSEKENVVKAVENFCEFFNKLQIRTTFASENQAVVIYDLDFPKPIGILSAAALMTIKNELVYKIELFYDARLFE